MEAVRKVVPNEVFLRKLIEKRYSERKEQEAKNWPPEPVYPEGNCFKLVRRKKR